MSQLSSWKRVLVACIAASAGLMVPLTPTTASAAVDLGAITEDQLNWYCMHSGYWGVVLQENKPWGWKCQLSSNYFGIDMNNVCRWQTGYSNAYAVSTTSTAYGWRCYRP